MSRFFFGEFQGLFYSRRIFLYCLSCIFLLVYFVFSITNKDYLRFIFLKNTIIILTIEHREMSTTNRNKYAQHGDYHV